MWCVQTGKRLAEYLQQQAARGGVARGCAAVEHVPQHPDCRAGVDALSEVIEHASEALSPLLVELVLCLPPQLEQVRRAGGRMDKGA